MKTSRGIARRRDVLELLGVPVPGVTADPRLATELVARKLFAATRILITPVLLIAALVAPVVHPAFWLFMVVRLLRAGNGMASALAIRLPDGARFAPVVDTLLGAGLILTTGGSSSPARIVMLGLPLVAGYLVSPRVAFEIVRSCVLAYLLGVLPDLVRGEPGAPGRVAGFGLVMLFVLVCSLTFSYGRETLTRRVAEIDAARRRLLNDSLVREDRERRATSQRLHGDALQLLLAAGQELDEGDRESTERARKAIERSVGQLRETVRDLHPAALRHSGLEAAVAAALAHRVHDVVSVEVAEEAKGERETLLLAVLRELADALTGEGVDRAVAARVGLEPVAVVLTLTGSGPDDAVLARVEAAVARTRERVEADGGALDCSVQERGQVTITVRICREEGHGAASVEDSDDVRRTSLAISSLLWLGLSAVAAVLVAAAGTAPAWTIAPFALLILFHGGAVALTWLRSRPVALGRAGTVASVLAFFAIVAGQGGYGTEAGALTVVLPFLLVLAFSPREVARLCLLIVCVSVPLVLVEDAPGGPAAAAMTGWALLASLAVTAGRHRMRLQLAGLERARRRVLHDSLAAADRERRRLSEELHNGPLQDLMSAGQDLEQALDGDPDAAAYGRAALAGGIVQLREVIADLHPPALDHGGLRPALEAVVERARQRARFAADIEVDAGADGLRDEFLLEIVRELVTNVRKHADAARVTVRITREGSGLRLVVGDDGAGMNPTRPLAAVLEGHIGLAATRERVEADGGTLTVDSAPGRGTTVSVLVPSVTTPVADPGLRSAA